MYTVYGADVFDSLYHAIIELSLCADTSHTLCTPVAFEAAVPFTNSTFSIFCLSIGVTSVTPSGYIVVATASAKNALVASVSLAADFNTL